MGIACSSPVSRSHGQNRTGRGDGGNVKCGGSARSRVETVFVVGERQRPNHRPPGPSGSIRPRPAQGDGQAAVPLGAGPEGSPAERRSSRSGESPRAAVTLDTTEGRSACPNPGQWCDARATSFAPVRPSPEGPRPGPLIRPCGRGGMRLRRRRSRPQQAAGRAASVLKCKV